MDYVLELIGIVAFTLVGVLVGIQYKLDIFGIYVISICSSFAGGILRDILLGITPPVFFTRMEYFIVAFVVVTIALVVFKLLENKLKAVQVSKLKTIINIVDAIGLGIFTVNGCKAAYVAGYGDNLLLVASVGVITAIGGGILRDILASRKPVVLRKEVYALIAVAGAIIFYLLHFVIDEMLDVYIVAILITGVRILSIVRHYNVEYRIKNQELKKSDDDDNLYIEDND